MTDPYDAVVAGHLCLDIYPDLTNLAPGALARGFALGRLVEGGPLLFCTGGAVSNTGLALVRLGIRTRLVARIGDDLLGQVVRKIVSSYGEDLLEGIGLTPQASTSYTLVISPPGTDRSFLYYPGANATFGVDDIDWAAVANARLFHFGYPSTLPMMYREGGAQLEDLFRRAKATGVTTSLDMTLPDAFAAAGRADWSSILSRSLPFVDLFLPSIEEALYTIRRPLYESLRHQSLDGDILSLIGPDLLFSLTEELLDMGARCVALKLGYRGFYLRTAGEAAIRAMGRARPADVRTWSHREIWAPCFQAQVVGTTGAGDAAIAGFLAALLRGLSPEEAVTAAVAVGACNVEAADSLSGVLSWEETWRRVNAGWARHPLSPAAEGWLWNADAALWLATTDKRAAKDPPHDNA